MLKVIVNIFSIIGTALAVYIVIIQRYELMPYLMFFVGLTTLILGLSQLKRKPKYFLGYMLIVSSLYAFFLSLEGFGLYY